MPIAFIEKPIALSAPWRIAVFIVAVFAANALVVVFGFALVSVTPVVQWARAARIPLAPLASVVAAIVATWAAGRIGDRDAPGVWRRIGLGGEAWRPAPVAWSGGVAVLALVVPTGVLLLAGAVRFESAAATDSWLAAAWTALALMVPAAATEELLFRGYLYTACRDLMGPARTIIATSVVFGLLHIFNAGATVASIAAVTVAGVFLGVVRLATGSLVAAFAAHLAFNLTQAVVLHAPVSGLAAQTPGYRMVPLGPDWLTGGNWGPEGGAAVMGALLAATFLVGRRAPRSAVSLPIPPAAAP